MARYLVTGAAGFIGSNIVDELVKRGAQVRAFDNLSTGKLSNLRSVMSSVEFVQGDITDPKQVAAAMSSVDYVLHQAALPSVPRSVEDPATSNNINAQVRSGKEPGET